MGKRGFPTQPAEIAKAKGHYRPSRHGVIEEKVKPEFLSLAPQPPEMLNPVGAKFWNDMLDQFLKINGFITIVDLPTFQVMATKYQTIVECNELLKTQSKWVIDHNGNTKENPVVKTLENAEKIFIQLAVQFGCTPAARNNIKQPEVPKEDPTENFKL